MPPSLHLHKMNPHVLAMAASKEGKTATSVVNSANPGGGTKERGEALGFMVFVLMAVILCDHHVLAFQRPRSRSDR